MEFKKTKNKIFDVLFISWSLFLIVALQTNTTFGQTIRSAGDFLQPGDVETSHILDRTILDRDVSDSAAVSATKVNPGGTTGMLLYSNGSRIATSTNFVASTTEPAVYIFGGKIHATSTNFNGFNQTWPTDDGTSGDALTTDGAGTLSWTAAATSQVLAQFTAGEAIQACNPVFVETHARTIVPNRVFDPGITGTSGNGFGTNATQRHANSMQESTAYPSVTAVEVTLQKVNSPTDNVVIKVETDAAGLPSGTVLAQGSIASASLTTSIASYVIDLNTAVNFAANTTYWITVSRSGALDDTNSYNEGTQVGSSYTNGVQAYYDGTWHSDAALDMHFYLTRSTYTTVVGQVYNTSALIASTSQPFVGFASGAIATSSAGNIVISGIATGCSGVKSGSMYYLGNATSTLSEIVGTFTRKAGMAVTTTSILVTNIW